MDTMSPDNPAARPPTRDARLANGLRVLVQERHRAPLVSVWCWYHVGSKDEPAGLSGVSHWAEHMNFRGTTNIPRDAMKGIVDRLGGTWNGYTWIDQTAYVLTAPADALDRLLPIEAERMARGLYHPDDCEAERAIVMSELEGSENDPEQVLETQVTAASFTAHPYGHPTIGWLDDLRGMTRDDLVGHYRSHYLPNNATLVVVGDVDADAALRLAAGHFDPIPAGPVPERRCPVEPPQTATRRVRIAREGTTAYLRLAYHAPAAADPDLMPLLVADAALTGARGLNLWTSALVPPPQRSARLFTALVETQLASAVGGFLAPTEDPFLYAIAITVSAGASLARVEDTALAELDRFRRDGLTPRELEKARAQLRARLVFDQDGVTAIGHQLGYFATVATLDLHESLLDRVASVSADDVWRVARRRLDVSNLTIGWFEPRPPAGAGTR